MGKFFFKIIFLLFFLSWSNISYSVQVLGTGVENLLGGDLTDPENDGVDGAHTNWNWTSINASSEAKWTHEGSFNVFDNKVGSSHNKWCCNAAPQWISVGFSQPYILTHFTITSGNDVASRRPDVWKIQGSNNGSNWTDIFVYDNDGTSPFSEHNQVLMYTGGGDDYNTPNAYSYFRYYVTSTGGGQHQINELEYFGNSDNANPLLSSSTPADNATLVAVDANIVLNFDEIVDVESGNITIKKTSDNSVIEAIDVTSGLVSGSGSSQITVNPSVTLEGSTDYYVFIDSTAFDDTSGNSYAGISSTTTFNFSTADIENPNLISSTPTDDATNVEISSNIILNFNENVDVETGNITIKKTSDNSTFETIDISGEKVTGSGTSQITINPSSDFANDTEYYILIDATAFDDTSGNSYAGINSITSLNFTTIAKADPTKDKNVIGLIEGQADQAINVFTQSLGLVSSRLEYLRQNRKSNNLSRNEIKIDFANEMLASIGKALITPIKDMDVITITPNEWSSWSKGSIRVKKIGDTSNASEKEIDSQGIAFGFDKKLNDNDIYGFSFQYGQSDTDVGSSGSGIDGKNYSIAWYRTKPMTNDNFIEGTIGIGKIESDIERKSNSNTLTASRDGKQLFGSINFGNNIKKENFSLNPVLRFDLGYTELDGYEEEGTDALKYDDQEIKSGLLSLGFGFNNLINFNKSSLKPIGLVEIGLDFSDSSTTRLNYASDTSTIYTYEHDNISDYMLTTEIGFLYESNNNLIINTSYKRIQGEKNEHSDTIIFGLNFETTKETIYALNFGGSEEISTGLNISKNLKGFDLGFNIHQEFNENLDKNAEISVNKKF